MAQPRKFIFTLDTYLSILAVVSSFCAIGITFYQAYLQRTQQYASVMPVLDCYVNNGQEGKTYRFDLIFVNNGIGPAFVKTYEYRYKGRQFGSFPEMVRQVAVDRIGKGRLDSIPVDNIVYSGLWPGRVMPPNQEVKLVSILSNKLARWFEEANSRGEININIRYGSIYDEQWNFQSAPRKMEWRNVKVTR